MPSLCRTVARESKSHDHTPAIRVRGARQNNLKCPTRVRVEFGGVTVADSTRALVMREADYPPGHYFPREDVRMDLLIRTEHATRCPYKGAASYWTIKAGGRTAENAVWSCEDPIPGMTGIIGYLVFYRDRMDGWSEEDLPSG